MATLYSDNFNRADSASLGGSWVTGDGFTAPGITGNAARALSDESDSLAYWNAATPDDQWAEVVLGSNTYICGPAIRITNGAGRNCYFTQRVDDDIHLAGFEDDGYFAIDVYTPASINPGDTVRLEAEGTTLRMYYNDVLALTNTDFGDVHTSGFTGFFTYYQASSIDAWEAGDFNSGASITGSGTPAAQAATASGAGERIVRGTGAPAAQAATAAGTGTSTTPRRTIRPATILAAQSATVAGTGVVS